MAAQSAGKNNNNGSMESRASRGSNHSEELNKLNNWSMHNDNNNKLANYTQQQESKEATKSSYELYQEAADLLGLSCSLCDNCRCMDCQVSEREREGIKGKGVQLELNLSEIHRADTLIATTMTTKASRSNR